METSKENKYNTEEDKSEEPTERNLTSELRVISQPADGDCLFNSVITSMAIGGILKRLTRNGFGLSPDELRNKLAEIIQNKEDSFDNESFERYTREEYAEALRNNLRGTHQELRTIADKCGLNIVIRDLEHSRETVIKPNQINENNYPSIYLAYNGNNHYDAAVKINEEKLKEEGEVIDVTEYVSTKEIRANAYENDQEELDSDGEDKLNKAIECIKVVLRYIEEELDKRGIAYNICKFLEDSKRSHGEYKINRLIENKFTSRDREKLAELQSYYEKIIRDSELNSPEHLNEIRANSEEKMKEIYNQAMEEYKKTKTVQRQAEEAAEKAEKEREQIEQENNLELEILDKLKKLKQDSFSKKFNEIFENMCNNRETSKEEIKQFLNDLQVRQQEEYKIQKLMGIEEDDNVLERVKESFKARYGIEEHELEPAKSVERESENGLDNENNLEKGQLDYARETHKSLGEEESTEFNGMEGK